MENANPPPTLDPPTLPTTLRAEVVYELHLGDESNEGEVLNELEEYRNAGKLCGRKIINSFDGDELAFQCMIGFSKFVAYFDPSPINIITRKAYNTIMVDGLEIT
ncbi:hypothetical protein Tco_0444544 [Tanacetum coccineum]